jgi:hypothetical protein
MSPFGRGFSVTSSLKAQTPCTGLKCPTAQLYEALRTKGDGISPQTPGMSATVFDVWPHVAGKMHRLDLIKEPSRLERGELVAVRAGLRMLQCKPNLPQTIQDVAMVMLTFLDGDNNMFAKLEGRLFE